MILSINPFSSGQPKVHIAERVGHYAVVLYFQKESPYREPMNKVLASLVEAGISYKVLADALSRIEVKNLIHGGEKLDLQWAMSAFVILILFGTISAVVLLAEIVLSKLFYLYVHKRQSYINTLVSVSLRIVN